MLELVYIYLVIGFIIGLYMVFSGRYSLKRKGKYVSNLGDKWLMVLIITFCWPKGFIDSV